MATTRAQAISSIATIEDKKSNTASKVREVITKVLEYTETVPVSETKSTEFFHIWSSNQPAFDNIQNQLFYSFKGVEGTFMNFTFRLMVSTPETKQHVYAFKLDIPDNELKLLKSIMEVNNPLSFIMPLEYVSATMGNERVHHIWVKVYFRKDFAIVIDLDESTANELNFTKAQINTSIALHNAAFKLG